MKGFVINPFFYYGLSFLLSFNFALRNSGAKIQIIIRKVIIRLFFCLEKSSYSSTICMMRLMLLLRWLMMSGTRSTTTMDVSRPKALGSSMPILPIRA